MAQDPVITSYYSSKWCDPGHRYFIRYGSASYDPASCGYSAREFGGDFLKARPDYRECSEVLQSGTVWHSVEKAARTLPHPWEGLFAHLGTLCGRVRRSPDSVLMGSFPG